MSEENLFSIKNDLPKDKACYEVKMLRAPSRAIDLFKLFPDKVDEDASKAVAPSQLWMESKASAYAKYYNCGDSNSVWFGDKNYFANSLESIRDKIVENTIKKIYHGFKNWSNKNPNSYNNIGCFGLNDPITNSHYVQCVTVPKYYGRPANSPVSTKASGTSGSSSYGSSTQGGTRVLQATITKNGKSSFTGTLFKLLSDIASLAANSASSNAPVKKHSGGKIPGNGEVMAILQGGETVRTEGQEAELQDELSKKQTASIEKRNDKIDELQKKRLLNEIVYTKDMKNFIINTISEAYNYNKYGFRKLIGG